MRLTLARVSLVVLGALLLFGLWDAHLFSQLLWTVRGQVRFEAYLAASSAVLGFVAWRWPGQVLRLGTAAMLLWAAWWSGPVAPAVVLFFLGSCYALGRTLVRRLDGFLATLLGAAVWITVLWAALHFPVDYWWVYLIAFALPYAFVRPPWRIPVIEGRAEAIGAAVLLVVLGAQFLAALKPEISSDGLSMHLALPAVVARQGWWAFDHRAEIWALMPAGADALYTGVYLLGGEAAAKLLNFACLGLIAGLLVSEGRRWSPGVRAWLGAALFVSTPLVLLVTGSLFVENVWAALLLGATIALVRGELAVSGALTGVAVTVKLIAAAFAAPWVLVMAVVGIGRWRSLGLGLALAAILAVPPYVFAYAKSGNPVFPFVNTLFQSPDYHTDENFKDSRFEGLHPGLAAPYELTFQSGRYIEGQGGAAGFQYLWLLLPGLLLARRREQWIFAGIALAGAAIVLLGAPNLRYLYGAMPLLSLVIACAPWSAVLGAAMALNLWLLPAAGFYDREFALFAKSETEAYLTENGPSVLLIDRLNREAPGEPVALFSDGATARLAGRAYTDSWHNEHYWKRVREAETPAAIAGQMRALGIRYVVAPTERRALFDVVQRFQQLWLDPEPNGTVGKLTLYHLREQEREVPKDLRPLGPGRYDDREPRIEYSGAWFHDNQFAEPVEGTLSYSDTAGAALRFLFEGRAVTLVFTRAENRGIAEVRIDGAVVRQLKLYARPLQWQARETVRVPAGVHTVEIVVSGRMEKNSAGTFVDLDAVEVE